MRFVLYLLLLLTFSCGDKVSVQNCDIMESVDVNVLLSSDSQEKVEFLFTNANLYSDENHSVELITAKTTSSKLNDVISSKRINMSEFEDFENFSYHAFSLVFPPDEIKSNNEMYEVDFSRATGYILYLLDSEKGNFKLVTRNFTEESSENCALDATVIGISTNHIWEANICMNNGIRGDMLLIMSYEPGDNEVSLSTESYTKNLGLSQLKKTTICEVGCVI